MSLLLLVLGLFCTAVGAGMIGFGIPINEFGLGNTLISAGVTALVGGLLLIGLSAAVKQLKRLADAQPVRPGSRLNRTGGDGAEPQVGTRPALRPSAPTQRRPAPPEPAPELRVSEPRAAEPRVAEPRVAEPRLNSADSVNVSAEAIDRLRSSIPRFERAPESAPQVVQDEVPLSPRAPMPRVSTPPTPATVQRPTPDVSVTAETVLRGPEPNGEAPPAPSGLRLNFPWRTKPRQEMTVEPQGSSPSGVSATAVMVETKPAAVESSAPSAPRVEMPPRPAALPRRAQTPPSQQPVAILKSGVVDGMAYTLYADGSIEAKLPEGTVRFGSIAELRNHLESNENNS